MAISIVNAVSAMLLGLIMREAPKVRDSEELQSKWLTHIEHMMVVHTAVASGEGESLVDPAYDPLLLAAVNYRESRMRYPAPDGDCHLGHRLDNVPRRLWPEDYRPKVVRVCNVVGPMQISKGSARFLQVLPEVQAAFAGRDWSSDPFTVASLKEDTTSVKLAHAILLHWKHACRSAEGDEAPMGVWLTAYRYGKCPAGGKGRRYHVDTEAKARCEIANSLANGLSKDDELAYSGATAVPCTYADIRVARN